MAKQYLELLRTIQDHGVKHEDRTGTGTTRIFGYQMRFDLNEGFPLLTTKKLPFRWIVEELLWFLSGSTHEPDLREKGVDIWKEWATPEQCARFGRKEGDLGPVYGWAWRNFGGAYDVPVQKRDGVDQIYNIMDALLHNSNSRRIILSGWHPKEATRVAIPPCHTLTQFAVIDGKISAQMYQRSADVFLGVPFNIASYALLVHIFARLTGLGVGDFVHTFGDVHIYRDHEEQVAEQLSREPRSLPKLEIELPSGNVPLNDVSNATDALMYVLEQFESKHFKLQGYDPHPKIAADVSV